ncbi:MAG: S1C family serine protease [Oscillospiraceae bacterium]
MKRLIPASLAVLIIFTLIMPVSAIDDQTLAADTLYTLDLIEGTDSGYELDRVPTRLETLIFTLRLAGLADDAEAEGGDSPFTDVPDWATQYVGYAYTNSLIEGADALHFGSDAPVRDKDFFTLILRILGYSEDDGDFTWALSSSVAVRLGIAESLYTEFDRGDMFECALAALTCRMKEQDITLIDYLAANGDIDSAKASALGLSGERPLTAREISDRYTASVALLECYDTSANIINRTPASSSSAFFISDDGVMVTNYHTIDKAIYAVITLDSGEQYAVERVLYYDPDIDVSVIKVSQTSMGGNGKTVFPYLNLMSSKSVHVGDTVYALGNPLGMQNSLSSGIISNTQRVTTLFELPMLQNTASISQGSSGGALFNEYGYVIGITSGYFSYGQDMYLSVPIDAVLDADLSGDGMTLPQVVTAVQKQKENEATAG